MNMKQAIIYIVLCCGGGIAIGTIWMLSVPPDSPAASWTIPIVYISALVIYVLVEVFRYAKNHIR